MVPYSRTATIVSLLLALVNAKDCTLEPLGDGFDDTDQVLDAIAQCGNGGTTTFGEGLYNITRKMTWELQDAKVDLHGFLSFVPDVEYWLDAENTYRVVFIQSQASWFVVTGQDFEIDAHGTGGIQGNGQPWWDYFRVHQKADGDGRPISLTLHQATNGTVKDFQIQSPPFWCNTVAESNDIQYDGMTCHAVNENPEWYGQNAVPNTDGICFYRSDDVRLNNWNITIGDDCLAFKGNSSNIVAHNISCHGGNGIAFGSLGQYYNLTDNISHVRLEDIKVIQYPNLTIQPNMANGIYFKSWTDTVNGEPPTGGGGGGGLVTDIEMRNVVVEGVNTPIHLYQTNEGHSGDTPSELKFGNMSFINWSGQSNGSTLVNLDCSPAVGCGEFYFENFQVQAPNETEGEYRCNNVIGVEGLPEECVVSDD
ncbi:glycoside hydrolase family 28 protein [Cylindrobasidium torrendii FP15055 ss-10]|uniref:galacturonan 1,4-alpha-galacturonidase n=1 Tax=Cylindrobasidium torrendii FP15055 ss-10 TaxID=1314674 RepID=A0A0D7AYM9_9AGAR|nr:glycoside hydrolase family 28 protein [Cylindrobasidium torrendii FP15055 ss-10]